MSDSKNSENAATISAIVESPADIIDKSIDRNSEAKSETECNETMSKRKQKKLLKMARYQEMKKLKRQKEKQKYKEKRKAEAAAGVAGPGRERKLRKLNTMENSSNKVSVAIDFDYDELMSDKDIAKCVKQLLRVYTLNRKSSMPIQLHYTSLNETNRVKQALAKNIGYENWDVNIHQETYLDLFSHDRIVYLSSESENVLEELDPNAVYIIGGLVDHNHHKGLSLDRAEKKSLKTARLPLNEYISMKTRTVLTIVHGKFKFFFCA